MSDLVGNPEDQFSHDTAQLFLLLSLQETGITEISMEEENSRICFGLTGRSWEILRQHFPDILSKVFLIVNQSLFF